MGIRSRVGGLAAAAFAAVLPLRGYAAPGEEAAAGWTERVACGPLTLEVSASRTAHLFHVVDQLSGWSEFCHPQYGKAFPLDEGDRAALERHKGVRTRRGWGGGLEQAFYVKAPIEDALRAAEKAGHLSEGEVVVEREVLGRFADRVDGLLRSQAADLRKTLTALDRDAVTRMAKSLSRLCGVTTLELPVFLLASPPPGGGGGYNGGRLTLEVCPGEDPAPTLVHETVHAFLERKTDLLEKCAAGTDGLDAQTLNEGIAYAVMPGIFSAGREDRLAAQVARDLAAGRGLDQAYPRFNRYGLALRPVVREALEKGDLPALLARARDVWLSLREVEAARQAPRVLSAGPGWKAFRERMHVLRPGIDPFSFNHWNIPKEAAGLKRGDLLALLFAGDSKDRDFPQAWNDVLPVPLADVWRAVEEGRTVEKAGTARGARVVLLAAPTTAALERLIRETKTLAE